MEFMGYKRPNGKVGTRNYIGVLSSVVCANEVANTIADNVQGAVAFTHSQGCCQTPVDIDIVNKTLVGLGSNPNLASVLIVSLGCESADVDWIAEQIRESGKQVEVVSIHEIGGQANTVAKGTTILQKLALEASTLERVPCPVSDLVLGLKCGSSDTTQGLSANPALGYTSDMLVENGGTSILGEVTEFIGAEHLLVRHAKNQQIGAQILDLVKRMENRAKSVGCDMRGGQPTGGNIKGGLTTIEEKSLGAIAKGGNATINAVYEYGQSPEVKGLVVMDSPGREPEILTGLASAGANIIAFTTGRGAPQGFPFVPVVKITGNPKTWESLNDHLDLEVSSIMDGTGSIPEEGKRIFQEIINVASGKLTRAEISGYTKAMNIYVVGPVI